MKDRQPLKLNAFNCNLFETEEFTINGYKMIMVNDLDYDFRTFRYDFKGTPHDEFFISLFFPRTSKRSVEVFFDFKNNTTIIENAACGIHMSAIHNDAEIEKHSKINILTEDQDISKELSRDLETFAKRVNKEYKNGMKGKL